MEKEQGRVCIGAGGDVGDGGGAGDAGVELAQVDRVVGQVDQHVDLEEADVALLGEPVAQASAQVDGPVTLCGGQRLGEEVVAAPAALVRRQLWVARQVGHEGADERAVARDAGLDRSRIIADALHDLQLLADHVLRVAVPVVGGGDEERRLA